MKFATHNPDNAREAEDRGPLYGIHIEAVDCRDIPRLEQEEAQVILDWHYLPDDYRDRLINGSAVRVVGIRGYDVAGADFLTRRGTIISADLDDLFAALAGARPAA